MRPQYSTVSVRTADAAIRSRKGAGTAVITPMLSERTLDWQIRSLQLPVVVKFKVRLSPSVVHPLASHFFKCGTHESSALEASLLSDAAKTGDINLICKDGSKVPAHAAVLSSIPYFESKLKADWSGVQWNMHRKLDLQLPCPVDSYVAHVFLQYAYGDPSLLHQVGPSDAAFLQELLALAEAADFNFLCASVMDHVAVTEDTVSSWLEWLANEHGPNVRTLEEKVKRVVKRSFEEASVWDEATVEELAELNRVAKKRKAT